MIRADSSERTGKTPLRPIILGLGGVVVLLGLGIWQMQRLDWKTDLIAEAEARLSDPPAALPAEPDRAQDDHRPVFAEGRFPQDAERYVLTSQPPHGPGFRVIVPFETDTGRRILVDRGFVPETQRDPESRTGTRPEGTQRIEGILRWPRESNVFTPDPDTAKREWYARDVAAMAETAGTEAVMIVQGPTGVEGWPRGTRPAVTMRNPHLGYALTWFSLAAIWVAMAAMWFRKLARESRRA